MQPSTPHIAVWPGRTFATGGRPLRVDMPGGRLVFGRTAALAMPHASGRSNEFLSRRAVQVGLDRRGRPYVANLSARHEVVVRPWGRGASSDESLGAAVDASGPVRYLTSGWHWVRNGRPWDSAGRRYGTLRGDDRSSWLLLEVVDAAPAVSVPADTWTGTATFGQTGRPREWQLNDPQYRAVLVYFATYLGWPPAIAPEIPSDTTAERLAQGVGEVSRIDHLVDSASRRGFPGNRTDLLSWLIAEGHVNPREVALRASAYGLTHLLLPAYPYRPAS